MALGEANLGHRNSFGASVQVIVVVGDPPLCHQPEKPTFMAELILELVCVPHSHPKTDIRQSRVGAALHLVYITGSLLVQFN